MADDPTPSEPGLGAAPDPGLTSAPGAPAPPPPLVPQHRSRALYDPDTGKLDVKKLAAWIGGIAAVIGTLSAGATKVEGWAKWWLEIEDLERRATTCEARVTAIERELHPTPPRPDANARLNEVLPRLTHELRDARKERQTHEQAITRLSTIHEYGLTRTREREAAREARQSIQWRRERRSGAESDSAADELDALEGL